MLVRVLIISMFSFLLCGCAAVQMPCTGKSIQQYLDATELKPIFMQMAAELCDSRTVGSAAKCTVDDSKRQTVLVTDFVDLKSFLPEHSGLIMGELMRGSLNQSCCYNISQAEFGKYFKLNEQGLISLTRKASEISSSDFSQPEVVVGTYSFSGNSKITLFARRINTSTGNVVRMVTREIHYSCIGRKIVYGVK